MNVATISTNKSADSGVVLFGLLALILGLINAVACWRVFVKAKQAGWASLIPFYNIYIQLKIVGRPGWWLLLYFIPLVNVVTHAVVSVDLAHTFRKSNLFGIIGLFLLPPIGYWILGFSDAKYKGAPKRR